VNNGHRILCSDSNYSNIGKVVNVGHNIFYQSAGHNFDGAVYFKSIVGISTSNPAYTLDVAGTGRFTSNVTLSNVSLSNATFATSVTGPIATFSNVSTSNVTINGLASINNVSQPSLRLSGGTNSGAGSTISLMGAGGANATVGVELNPFDNGASAEPSAQMRAVDIDSSAYLDFLVRQRGGGNIATAPTTMLRLADNGAIIGGTTQDTSAILNVNSTTQGVLIPRMTGAQRTSIGTPAAGLQVFDTTDETLYMYTGAFWSIVPVIRKISSPIGSAIAGTTMDVNGISFRYNTNLTNGNLEIRSATTSTKLVTRIARQFTAGTMTAVSSAAVTLNTNTGAWSLVNVGGLISNESGLVDIMEISTEKHWRVKLMNVGAANIYMVVESF
jgi:hypothetical protein